MWNVAGTQVQSRVKRTAFEGWCWWTELSIRGRHVIAMWGFKTKLEVFRQWRATVVRLRQRSDAVMQAMARIMHRTLYRAFAAWVDFVVDRRVQHDKVAWVLQHYFNRWGRGVVCWLAAVHELFVKLC